jgi:phospholipase C
MLRRRRLLLPAVALVALLLAIGPVLAAAQPGTPAATPAGPPVGHIFVIVLENHEYGDVIGNSDLPYLNELARRYGVASASYAVAHPSLPNYLALTGGDTFGITSDCTHCFVNAPNLVDQVEAAGKSWKAYMEDMPRPCFLGNHGRYAQKHDPFIYYDDIRTDPSRCDRIVPFAAFVDDLTAQKLPDFAWITPDQCDDMHSCSAAHGDKWLKTWVPRILDSPAWQDGGVLFVTYDEGTTDAGCCGGAGGGHIATLVISPLVDPGAISATPTNHYGLLRTIEDAWGLPYLGGAADAAPLTDLARTEGTPPAA